MATYKALHTYDALPSKRDARDFRMMAVDLSNLPEQVSLPRVPILNQGREGSCVGHGCAGARETLEILGGNPPPLVPLSRAFIYFMARRMENTENQDVGAQVRDGCKVMQEVGVCDESLFPYTDTDFKTVPPDLDIAEAAKYKIGSYARLNSSGEIRYALSVQMPVVIGVAVFQSFETQIGPDGRVPLPGSSGDVELGGHCMFIHSYKPDPQNIGMYLFGVQNSWGDHFADSGTCWMPQAYLDNPNFSTDLWSIALT